MRPVRPDPRQPDRLDLRDRAHGRRQRAAAGLRGARRQRSARRSPGARPDSLERAIAKIDAERQARSLLQEAELLRPSERAVFELVAVDGLSLADAASALEISPTAARVRLHRARRALRGATTPTLRSLSAEEALS